MRNPTRASFDQTASEMKSLHQIFFGTLIFALGALVALSGTGKAQEVPALNRVTLFSRIGHGDWSRTAVNFDSGHVGAQSGVLTDFDLIFGSLAINNDSDWFQVRDPRSVIADLGAKQWGDFRETPSLSKSKKPRKPLPLTPVFEVDASAGAKETSPYRQFVRVKAGHMYLMKVARGQTKSYVMFRVDNLVNQDNCLVSWKKVPPPAEDVEK